MFRTIAGAVIILLLSVAIGRADTITLTVDTTSQHGTLFAALYNSEEAFDARTPLQTAAVPALETGTEITFCVLTSGEYGVAIFHDQNGNEDLDVNLFGAPREPYGFSRNPPIFFSAPNFKRFAFAFDGQPLRLSVMLNQP